MNRRLFIGVATALAVAGTLVGGCGAGEKSDSTTTMRILAVGEQVPSTSLPRLDGDGDESLAQYEGRWVLVNFWASWCEPCKQEAPALEEFQRQHGGAKFTVLGIDTRDLTDDGREFARSYGLSYPLLRDGDGGAAHGFGTTGVPANFLVDPKGTVRWLLPGPVDEQYLQEEVAPLIAG